MKLKYRVHGENGAFTEYSEIPESGNYEIIEIIEPSQEEIQEQQIKEALSSETERYIKRQQDGVQMYAEISAEFRLAKLNGLMSESTQSAIEKILISVRNEVLAGQWISAKNELELIGNSNIGADLYNRLHNQISNYITENY